MVFPFRPFVLFAAVLTVSSAAWAGPPLICQPFEIGAAKSLPWGGGRDWNSPDAAYNVKQLVPDTLALLVGETPVLVRMETLRRAAIYGAKDQRAAFELLSRLMARAVDAGAAANSSLALFDAGYFVETLKQASWIYKWDMLSPDQKPRWSIQRNPVEGLDGYSWVRRALERGGADVPSMELAASLMLETKWPNEHFRKAVAGAPEGSLAARHILLHFGDKAKTIAEVRAKLDRK